MERKNEYVKEGKVIGNYSNGYILDVKGNTIGYYSNGYVLDKKTVGHYGNGWFHRQH